MIQSAMASRSPNDLGSEVCRAGWNWFCRNVRSWVNFSGFQLNDIVSGRPGSRCRSICLNSRASSSLTMIQALWILQTAAAVSKAIRQHPSRAVLRWRFGIMLDVSAKLQVVHTWDIGIVSNKWPIFSHVLGAWAATATMVSMRAS